MNTEPPTPHLRPFDAAEFLETRVDLAQYLVTLFEENDPRFIASALGDIARAQGIADAAFTAGLDPAEARRTLAAIDPESVVTLVRLFKALELRLSSDLGAEDPTPIP